MSTKNIANNLQKTFYSDAEKFPSIIREGQFTKNNLSVARVKAVYNQR